MLPSGYGESGKWTSHVGGSVLKKESKPCGHREQNSTPPPPPTPIGPRGLQEIENNKNFTASNAARRPLLCIQVPHARRIGARHGHSLSDGSRHLTCEVVSRSDPATNCVDCSTGCSQLPLVATQTISWTLIHEGHQGRLAKALLRVCLPLNHIFTSIGSKRSGSR